MRATCCHTLTAKKSSPKTACLSASAPTQPTPNRLCLSRPGLSSLSSPTESWKPNPQPANCSASTALSRSAPSPPKPLLPPLRLTARKTTSPSSPSPSPPSRSSMRSTALILLLLLAPLAAAAQPGAPPVDARQLPTGILDLTHNWRAQEGDNPAWSAPNLDDRNWPVEALYSSAASQPGWRWFRLTLCLPQDSAPPLSLLLDGRKGAYELYIDGR